MNARSGKKIKKIRGFEGNNCDTPNEFGKSKIVRRQEYLLRDKTALCLRNVVPLWLRNDHSLNWVMLRSKC